MKEAYIAIFARIGVKTVPVQADSGAMGGSGSEEFVVFTEVGEDRIVICGNCDYRGNVEASKSERICPKCKGESLSMKNGIEVGHIFQLGRTYSDPMHIEYADEQGVKHPTEMGCYGIGMTRIIAATVEQSHDEKGIIWPPGIAPFQAHLIGLNLDKTAIRKKADKLYATLRKKGIEVLFDDREISPGKKFADADLIGIPIRLTISPRSLEAGGVEWKERSAKESRIIDDKKLMSTFRQNI